MKWLLLSVPDVRTAVGLSGGRVLAIQVVYGVLWPLLEVMIPCQSR